MRVAVERMLRRRVGAWRASGRIKVPEYGKTYVVIAAGKFRGRLGWIWGDFASRRKQGVSVAMVHMKGETSRFRKLDTLTEATPIEVLCGEL